MTVYDTYHYRCPRCFARVQVTPTNANRMLYLVCIGRETSEHAPAQMQHHATSIYHPGRPRVQA